MSAARFLLSFLRTPRTTGAVAPSSRALARVITDAAALTEASAVVEFGPGTGVFTETIRRKIRPEATFFAMEINSEFAATTRARCPGVLVVEDSAVNTAAHLRRLGLDCCDRIVCGLPWASFPKTLQHDLMTTILDVLSPDGRFVTFAYLQGLLRPAAARFRRTLHEHFERVTTTPTVWRNFPPAFVYCADHPRRKSANS